jgi:GTP pyrophosphokinase
MVMESKDVIMKSLRFIENNLEGQLNIVDIASYLGYSEYHFSRMFKSQMEVSVMEYVKRRKLIKASNALIEGGKIIDVAFQYGWLSHSGFTKAFKQEFGISPALLKAMIMQIDCLGGNTMNHVFMGQTEEHATKEQLYEILKEACAKNESTIDVKKLEKVYEAACIFYEGKTRYSGDEYITHPLNVSIILTQMEAGENAICAGLLCDVLQKTEISVEELKSKVHGHVANIVIRLKDFDAKQINISDSEEVIMVKLAERLHNMRTIEFMDENMKTVKAKETIDLFLPIARRIGNEKLVEELNDLALKYI